MKVSKGLLWLTGAVLVLGALAAGIGLFTSNEGSAWSFTTLHGREIEIYGRGLYANDWAFRAPVLRGTDAVMLFIGVPALAAAMLAYRRGTRRGHLLLLGLLACFLYVAASVALGAAFNRLYLLYLLFFAASLWAFLWAFASLDVEATGQAVRPGLRRPGLAIFLVISGLSPLVWLMEIIAAQSAGDVPEGIAAYTTDVTTLLDVGIILPACMLAGLLLWRGKALGYPLASTLMILLSLIGLIVAGQTVMQSLDGIELSTGQYVAYVAPFLSLSLIAVWLTRYLLVNIGEQGHAL